MKGLFFIIIFFTTLYSQKQQDKQVNIYAFLQPTYEVNLSNTFIPNNEFKINRVRLGIENEFSDWLRGEIELDPLDKFIIKDAVIGFNLFNKFQVTIGRHKIPFSFERLTSVKNIPFIERSKIVKELDQLGYCGRDIGMRVSYSHQLNDLKIKLITGIFNGNSGIINGDNNNSKSFSERLEISKGKIFKLGINSSQKFDSLTAKYFVANGLDFSIKIRKNISVTSEFLYGKKNSQISIGGHYTLLEYEFNDIVFGFRFNQYFKDLRKSPSNFYEAKLDWKPEKFLRFQFNLIREEKNSKFDNNFLFGVSYEI